MKVLQVIERSWVYCIKRAYPARISTYAELMTAQCEYFVQDYRQICDLSYYKFDNEEREIGEK